MTLVMTESTSGMETWELEIFISEEYRNLKLGTRVIPLAISWLREEREGRNWRLRASTSNDNHACRRILEKNGFVEDSSDTIILGEATEIPAIYQLENKNFA